MMKRNLLLVVLSLFALLTMAQGKGKNYVEVLYFHGKQRCATCIAIEKYAREVVEKDFADERKKERQSRIQVGRYFDQRGRKDS